MSAIGLLRRLAGADPLQEGSKHNPFKDRFQLGPGPKNKVIDRTGAWDCHAVGPGSQYCRNKVKNYGRTITPNPEKTRAYRKLYRAWKREKERRAEK